MKELIKINGTKEINGKEIKVIEGGFGEGCKILTDKQISEIHNMRNADVRRRLNDNIKRFKKDIDIIDLKGVCDTHTLESLGYHKSSITQAENIYALSERGYSKLIKIMDTDLAWEIHDELIDSYFAMRKIINSDEQLKAQLLLNIYNGGQEGVLASKQLTEIEVKEATKPLLDKIENDKPLVEFSEQVLKSNDNILIRELAKIISDEVVSIGQNRLYERLRDWGYIMKNKTEPYQKYIDNGYFVLEEKTFNTPYGTRISKTTKATPRGQVAIVEKFRRELNLAS